MMPMSLIFSNPTRSYESGRHGVRFWGHDQSLEVGFLVTEAALRELETDVEPDAASFLQAFDRHLGSIHAVAHCVYARGLTGVHMLGLGDFRRHAGADGVRLPRRDP